ncbi:MAG: hypothetical protein AAFX93_13930 [Verrucomicrobiota bacterium]
MKNALFLTLAILFAVYPSSLMANFPRIDTTTNVTLKQAINDALAAAEYRDHWMVMVGDGTSMDPYYGGGSVLLVSKTNYRCLKPGMMAVFRDREGDLVGHWLIEKVEGGWVSQGVNNGSADSTLVTERSYVGVIFGVLNSAGPDAEGIAYARSNNLPTVIGKRN